MFDALDGLLSELDEQGVDQFGKAWPTRVATSLAALRESYKVLTDEDREVIDYSDLATQAAYVFAYAIGRCGFTSVLLSMHAENVGSPLFGVEELVVASLGGGPGSELAGLIEYLESEDSDESVSKVIYRVYDHAGEWKPVVERLVALMATDIEIELDFIECDLTKNDEVREQDLSDVDLVICSFLMSELCSLPDQKTILENFRYLLGTLSKGAMIFYNDSDASSFYYFFNNSRKFVKGIREHSEIKEEIDCGDRALGDKYEQWRALFGVDPRLENKALSKFLVREHV